MTPKLQAHAHVQNFNQKSSDHTKVATSQPCFTLDDAYLGHLVEVVHPFPGHYFHHEVEVLVAHLQRIKGGLLPMRVSESLLELQKT